jgi:hypothetical protein
MAERDWDRDWERRRRYRDEDFRHGGYGSGERDYARRGDERGFLERLREELRSWFGEEEPGRGRTREERESGRWGGSQDADPEWARQWGYFEGRGQRGSSARGWGYGGGYGAGPGYMGGAEYGYGAPMGWTWSGQQRWGRQPSTGPTYGEGWRQADEPSSERYGSDRYGRSERYGTERTSGLFRGSFAGRGPRGYQRSDDRIREEICERMCDNAELDASEIEIVVVSGEVTLQGSVTDRYDKRLAEDLTQDVSGVREVHNQLRVAPGLGGQDDQSQQPPQNRPGDPPRYRVA